MSFKGPQVAIMINSECGPSLLINRKIPIKMISLFTDSRKKVDELKVQLKTKKTIFMKKQFSNTIEIHENESEIYIVTLANKDKIAYKEINISLEFLLLFQGFDKSALLNMKAKGIFPKKEIYLTTWIPSDLYEGLRENDGLEFKFSTSPN